MKYIILALSFFFIYCGSDKSQLQHQTGFATTYFDCGDSLIIKIKADNGILEGESFRPNKNLLFHLKGKVGSDGKVSFSEYFDEGECFGLFNGNFNEFDKSEVRMKLSGIWQKPDTSKPRMNILFEKSQMNDSDYAEAVKKSQPSQEINQATNTNTPQQNKATSLGGLWNKYVVKPIEAAKKKVSTDKKVKVQSQPAQQPQRERTPRKETESEISRRQGVKKPNSPAGGIKER